MLQIKVMDLPVTYTVLYNINCSLPPHSFIRFSNQSNYNIYNQLLKIIDKNTLAAVLNDFLRNVDPYKLV
jgi:hypothetical protein